MRDPEVAAKADDVRQRLRKRVDQLLGEIDRAAGKQRPEAAPVEPGKPAIVLRAKPVTPEPPSAEPAPASRRALVVEGNPLHRKSWCGRSRNRGLKWTRWNQAKKRWGASSDARTEWCWWIAIRRISTGFEPRPPCG